MISSWRKCSREFRGCQHRSPPPPPSTPRRRLRHLLAPPAGRNTRHDSSSSSNNNLNNNSRSSPIKRRITATTAMAAVVVGVAPPTPLQPRVCGPPTSTPGPTPFKCGRVPGGSVSSSLTCIHRLCWPMLFPMALHRRSGHPSHHHSCLCPFNVVSSRL
jgi:hypothetical protein